MMTMDEIRTDWLKSFAVCTSMANGIHRMQTETLQVMAQYIPDAIENGADPKDCRRLRRLMRAELARRQNGQGELRTHV